MCRPEIKAEVPLPRVHCRVGRNRSKLNRKITHTVAQVSPVQAWLDDMKSRKGSLLTCLDVRYLGGRIQKIQDAVSSGNFHPYILLYF